MIPSSRLEELAAKCEKATGGFPETRALLFEAYEALLPANGSFMVACIHAGAFLDAATTLVPEGWWLASVSQPDPCHNNDRPYACLVANDIDEIDRGYGQPPDETREVVEARASSLALALCAASLRAQGQAQGRGK